MRASDIEPGFTFTSGPYEGKTVRRTEGFGDSILFDLEWRRPADCGYISTDAGLGFFHWDADVEGENQMNEDEATNFASVVDELWAAKSRLRKIEAILDDDTEMREVIACSCDQSLALGDIIDKIQNVIDS